MTDKKMAAPESSRKHLPKMIIALQHLMGRSLIQLEAFNLYGETCLHSTISDLSNKHGIGFERQTEPHIHRGGGKTHFTRYRLMETSREAAQALVKHYQRKAGVPR